MLVIKAKGGLGNRMLSAASGIAYALATEREFTIDWTDGIYADKGVNAYPEMFTAPNKIKKLDIEFFSKPDFVLVPEVWRGKLDYSASEMVSLYYPKQHSDPLVYRKLSAPLTAECNSSLIEVFWAYTSKLGRIKPFVKGGWSSEHILKPIFTEYFTPCDVVQSQLDTLFLDKHSKCLGVHIRYTDLKVPLNKVLKRIQKCLDMQGYQKVFLATDNSDVERVVKKSFDNVITSKKRFSDGVEQLHINGDYEGKLEDSYAALFDMYALSMCDGLVYSSRSSFSRVSHIVGDFNKSNAFDIDRYNVLVRLKCLVQEYL